MEIITFIFNVIVGTVFLLLKLILAPIDYIISQAFPALSNGLTAVGGFLTIVAQGLGWAISASGIPYFAIALLASYFIFKLTVPINLWLIKLALSWYRTLKP